MVIGHAVHLAYCTQFANHKTSTCSVLSTHDVSTYAAKIQALFCADNRSTNYTILAVF